MAQGVTANVRGVYFSHPVYGDPAAPPVGVAVIKVSTGPIEREFRQGGEGGVLLLDPKGIVFATSRKEWLFRSLQGLTQEDVEEVARSQQFGPGPWEWSGLSILGDGTARDAGGRTDRFNRPEGERRHRAAESGRGSAAGGPEAADAALRGARAPGEGADPAVHEHPPAHPGGRIRQGPRRPVRLRQSAVHGAVRPPERRGPGKDRLRRLPPRVRPRVAGKRPKGVREAQPHPGGGDVSAGRGRARLPLHAVPHLRRGGYGFVPLRHLDRYLR